MLLALAFSMTALLCQFDVQCTGDLGPQEDRRLPLWKQRSLTIEPKTIRAGQSAMLYWFTRNASEILLEQAAEPHSTGHAECLRLVGRFPSKGSLQVSPRVSTTYVVSCADSGTTCAESISITVK